MVLVEISSGTTTNASLCHRARGRQERKTGGKQGGKKGLNEIT